MAAAPAKNLGKFQRRIKDFGFALDCQFTIQCMMFSLGRLVS